jgi:hypothetical protein
VLGNEAGGQAAGEEKAKGPEARKEGGQSAAAEAPIAVADSEPCAGCSSGLTDSEGRDGGKVRPAAGATAGGERRYAGAKGSEVR